MTSFTKQLWRPSEAGVLTPSGSVSETSNSKKTNLLHVKERAKEIEDLFATAGVIMSPTCGLAQLISNAQTVADRWFSNQTADSSMIDVFYALHLDRLADAILPLREVPGREKYLNALTSSRLLQSPKLLCEEHLLGTKLWAILRRNCLLPPSKIPQISYCR